MTRILIFTGEGKGKTTAALGLALRAAGHGRKIFIMQFLKSRPSGELAALAALPNVTVRQRGLGFTPPAAHPDFARHRETAAAALAEAAAATAAHDLIVLDEVCGAVAAGVLAEGAVLETMRQATGVIVLTGRGATPAMIALADTVTEMKSVKHGLDAGLAAQEGVEW